MRGAATNDNRAWADAATQLSAARRAGRLGISIINNSIRRPHDTVNEWNWRGFSPRPNSCVERQRSPATLHRPSSFAVCLQRKGTVDGPVFTP
jgi:hypothetical protein